MTASASPGRGGLIVHLIVWHFLWRLVLNAWRIPTFGPFLVLLIIAVFVGLSVWRRHRGPHRSRSVRLANPANRWGGQSDTAAPTREMS